jgi:DNA polymerase III subunit beta
MKIECVKSKLTEVVNKTERVVGKNLTLPILSCLLLEVKNNLLTIHSTNLDLGVKVSIPVRVLKDGLVAVPGNIFHSFISQLPGEGNVTLEVVEKNLEVKTAHIKTIIKTFNPEDFPIIPSVSDPNSLKVSAKDFVKGLRSVWYSSATSSMKPELSSVYIHQTDNGVVFAATDSFRLAEKKIIVKNLRDFNPILIPFRNTAEIIRVFEEIDDPIELHISKGQISINHNNIYLVSRVVDGSFPDYEQIIPKDFKTEVTVLKQDLLNALKISTVFSDNFNQVNIKVVPSKKSFEIKTENANIGRNVISIESVVKGEELGINFNHKYIIDCFQSIEADSVTLGFNGQHKAVVIKGVGDRSFTYLVMPMNR